MPAATPVKEPPELTVAIDEESMLHAPPVGVHVSVAAEPTQAVRVPPTAPGVVFTVIVLVVTQPPPIE